MLAADYSYSRPDPQALYDAGYRIVLRYLGTDSRCITRDELHRLHDAGLMVALIGQSTVLRPLGGYPAGVRDAERYNHLAADLDAPDWLPIFYVCDVGTEQGRSFPKDTDYPVIRQYASGILATPGRPVGQYGPYPVLEMLRDLAVNLRRIECWWQTAGLSGNGTGTGGSIRTGDGSVRRLSSLACMFQHVAMTGAFGGQIDHNTVHMEPVTWAWHPDQPDSEEDDMAPPVVMWTKPGSRWAREVAGRAEGQEVAAWLAYPSAGTIVHIVDEPQLNGDYFVGVKSLDFCDDQWFYNYAYTPHGRSSAVDVDEAAIVAGLRQPLIDSVTAVVRDQGLDVDEVALGQAVAVDLVARLQS